MMNRFDLDVDAHTQKMMAKVAKKQAKQVLSGK
jgi:hypothetical protein